jgi:hypothetical protein
MKKIKGTYFEGDFSALSQWLGTDLDYNKIQNMLLGEPLTIYQREIQRIIRRAVIDGRFGK